MDCRINNKILGLLMVGCLAVFAYAAADTISSSGDLTLDPGGNNVLPGSDSTDSLGATNNVWSEVWTDNIKSDGEISFKPSGDTDDYISFSTESGTPQMNLIGGNNFNFRSENPKQDERVQITVNPNYGRLRLRGADGGTYIYQYNTTDETYPGMFRIYAASGDIVLQPNGDTNDYHRFFTAGNRPRYQSVGTEYFTITSESVPDPDNDGISFQNSDGFNIIYFQPDIGHSGGSGTIAFYNATETVSGMEIATAADLTLDPVGNNVLPGSDNADLLGATAGGNQRWADVKSVLINGADICGEIGCWTETINSYNESDMCWTYEKPSETQRNIIALWVFNNYQEYYDATENPYKEDVYNEMRDKIVDEYGRPDFRLGRKITYCFNEIGRNQAAMDLILEELHITESDVKARQRELEKPVVSVGELKDKTGLNIITTTSTTTTTEKETTTTTIHGIGELDG